MDMLDTKAQNVQLNYNNIIEHHVIMLMLKVLMKSP